MLIKEKLLETLIELVGSKVVSRRPTDSDVYVEDADDEEAGAMPHARTPKTTEDVDTEPEPYQTPVALTPANWRKGSRTRRLVPAEDVESSDSGIEVIQTLKKRRAPKSPTDSNMKVMSQLKS
jgi:hypothetical protein